MNEPAIIVRFPHKVAERISANIERLVERDSGAAQRAYQHVDVSSIVQSAWTKVGLDQLQFEKQMPENHRNEDVEEFVDYFDPDFKPQFEKNVAAMEWERQLAHQPNEKLVLEYRLLEAPFKYAFKCGKEEYHATMGELPTQVEVHKSLDENDLVHLGKVSKLLLVHDVFTSEHRPVLPPTVFSNGVWLDGLAPCMKNVNEKRFFPVSMEGRRAEMGLDLNQVKMADFGLSEFKSIYAQKMAASVASTKKSKLAFSFVYDEKVDEPAWMSHLPPTMETVRLKYVPHPDKASPSEGFYPAMREYIIKAMETKTKKDEQKKQIEEMKLKFKS